MADERKNGPLSREDLMGIWRGASDPTYVRGLEEAGSGNGLEVIEQQAVQWERVSLAIDRTTQERYLKPHSAQTNESASGKAYAIVELTFERDENLERSLVLTAGDIGAEEVETDWGPDGGVPVYTGRKYFLLEDLIFLPGEKGPFTVTAQAERSGWGYNSPQPGTISFVRQVGERFENNRATVLVQMEGTTLQATGQADMFVPPHVGQYVLLTEGDNAGKVARITKFGAPDSTAAFDLAGSKVKLSHDIALVVNSVTGTFSVGEIITVTTPGPDPATLLLRKVVQKSPGKFALFGTALTGPDSAYDVGATVTTEAGDSATVLQVLENQGLVSEAPPVGSPTGGATWRIMSWVNDFGLTCKNVLSPAGGRPGTLDMLGREVDIDRAPNEDDESYIRRVDEAGDVVTPNAVKRAVARVMGNAPWCYREVGTPSMPGVFYDGNDFYDPCVLIAKGNFGGLLPSLPQGTPVTLKQNNADGPVVSRGYYAGYLNSSTAYISMRGDPGPLTPVMRVQIGFFQNDLAIEVAPDFALKKLGTYLSFLEFRAFFVIAIPRTGVDDFGAQWDFFAWDVGNYDGFSTLDAKVRNQLRQAVDLVKAFGVGFDIVFDNTCTEPDGFSGLDPAELGLPPVFLSISPDSGLGTGGTFFTLYGQNFVDGAVVTFAGVLATTQPVLVSTSITGFTPEGLPGFVDVQVINPDDQTTADQGDLAFEYTSAVDPITFGLSQYSEQRADLLDYSPTDTDGGGPDVAGTWEDRSGNNRSWVQANAALQPALAGVAINGAFPMDRAATKNETLPYSWATLMGSAAAFGVSLLIKIPASVGNLGTAMQSPTIFGDAGGYWDVHCGYQSGVLYVGVDAYDGTAHRLARAPATADTWLQVNARLVGGVLAIEVNAAPVNTLSVSDKDVTCNPVADASATIRQLSVSFNAPYQILSIAMKGGMTDANFTGLRAWWRYRYPALAGVLPV